MYMLVHREVGLVHSRVAVSIFEEGYNYQEEDTVVDLDDMADSIPGRSLGANVAEVKLITLHQPHI